MVNQQRHSNQIIHHQQASNVNTIQNNIAKQNIPVQINAQKVQANQQVNQSAIHTIH